MIDQIRHSMRSLLRAPTYTAAAVLTLALGIGATTGVVSIVDTVLLRSLPYRDADAIVMMLEQSDQGNQRSPSYLAYKDYARAVSGPVQGAAFIRGAGATLRRNVNGETSIDRFAVGFVTPGFFGLMGANALHGRTFAPDEEAAASNRVAVVSYAYWKKQFSGDPATVGKTVSIDSIPTTIIGVMPAGFAYPDFASMWIPIVHIETSDAALQRRGLHVDSRAIVRMKSANDSARAAALLAVTAGQLAAAYPEDAARWTHTALLPISNELLGDIKPTLFTLAAAATLVLLLGCLNVATLSLVRASVRAREMAVRAALGATQGRLMGALLVETAIITVAGAVAGVALCAGVIAAARRFAATALPRANELQLDARVLAIAIGVSLLAAVLSGLAPSWRATRMALVEKLHGGARGAAGNRNDTRTRGALVALQFAFAVMLLVGAGLLLQSFRRLQNVPDGYDSQLLAQVQINPPRPTYDKPADAVALYDRLRDAVKAVPGVEDAAIVNHPPQGAAIPSRADIPGRPTDLSSQSAVIYRTASAEYAHVMGTRMVFGRWFTPDDIRAPDAAGFVVNETMAKKFWPNATAIGQRLIMHRASQGRPDLGQPIEGVVIGVASDMRSFGRDALPTPEVFVPYTREVWPWITLIARSENPARVSMAIRKAILSVEPNIAVSADNSSAGVTIPDKGFSFGRRELALLMIVAFACAALLLAAIGLYGVIAYSVTQRTREVGIRMALGANNKQIARLVLGSAARVVGSGIVVGIGGAYAGTRAIQSLLFNTAPTDVATYIAVPLLLTAVAVCASWLPTARALRVQPTDAMRND